MRSTKLVVRQVLGRVACVSGWHCGKEKRVEETKGHLPVAKAINSTQVASAVRRKGKRTV